MAFHHDHPRMMAIKKFISSIIWKVMLYDIIYDDIITYYGNDDITYVIGNMISYIKNCLLYQRPMMS